MTNAPAPPKLFISYSWTSPQHKQWVLDLAKKLRGSGVDAILDTWDIKEGQDVIKFMEGMVTDSTINKVMMVVDKSYAEKADEREGGVGVESQIISKKIYDNHDQEKFVAIALEKDSEGKLILPVYCQSRMCIDFSEHTNKENYDKSVEGLLRWIFSTPEHEKPPIGTRPNFLLNKTSDSIPAITPYLRAIEAIKDDKRNVLGYITDYLETLSVEMETFRINNIEELKKPFDDAVIESIENFIPHRTKFIELILTMVKYGADDNYAEILHEFFERLIPYLYLPKGYTGFVRETDQDNFKFIIHELFLYTIAILLKAEKFEAVTYLTSRDYYMAYHPTNGQNLMVSYLSFSKNVASINQIRKRRLNLGSALPQANLLKERAEDSGVDFLYLVQADFILLMKNELASIDVDNWWWYPVTFLYTESSYRNALPIFVRSESIRYFNDIKLLLGIDKKNDIMRLFNSYDNRKKQRLRVGNNYPDLKSLINFDNLETTP